LIKEDEMNCDMHSRRPGATADGGPKCLEADGANYETKPMELSRLPKKVTALLPKRPNP
jgi:hypothetical protein